MTKYEGKMKEYEGNMKEYVENRKKYERNMKEIWRNIWAVGLKKIPGLPAGRSGESYADADTIPEMAPSIEREAGSPVKNPERTI